MITLSPRLQAVADMIPDGARVCDIGADHGYLAIYLAQNNITSRVIASDVNIEPLERGRKNSAIYGVQDKIDFILSDGLDTIDLGLVDTITICGMGGDTIADIIFKGFIPLEKKLFTHDIRLILQPMSSADDLRRFFYANGFEILTERLIKDAGRIYSVFHVIYTATEFKPEPWMCYMSPMLQAEDELFEEYLNKLVKVLTASVDGTARSKKPHDVERNKYFSSALKIIKGFTERNIIGTFAERDELMIAVNDIRDYLFELAPAHYAEHWDNFGHLVGSGQKPVNKIVVALDVMPEVITEALEIGAELIVAHHPVIMDKLGCVTDNTSVERRVMMLIENNISAICMHTNLDSAPNGTDEALARTLGLMETEPMSEDGVGHVGSLDESMTLQSFLEFVKDRLGSNGLRYVRGSGIVRKVATGCGSCGDYVEHAIRAGADTFITADIKYDQFLIASEAGLNLIDAGHFSTENVVVPVLADKLKQKFPHIEVHISKKFVQPEQYFI